MTFLYCLLCCLVCRVHSSNFCAAFTTAILCGMQLECAWQGGACIYAPHGSLVCDASCATKTDCGSCVATAGCGWCLDAKTCRSGAYRNGLGVSCDGKCMLVFKVEDGALLSSLVVKRTNWKAPTKPSPLGVIPNLPCLPSSRIPVGDVSTGFICACVVCWCA
jgi:hypothetical protein